MSGTTSNNNVIGSGSDSIVLNVSEDQAAGTDAEFSVNVNGQQIGGLETATASHSAGQDETFTFLGNWAPGSQDVTVTFANNFLYPGTAGDRNLYVDGVTYDGQTVSNSTTPIYQSPLFPPNSTAGDIYGNASFTVNDTTAIPSGAASTPTTTPGPVAVGSGADTLVLDMAEDPYQGDAQFTVAVDGQQIGGTQTTSAIVSQGQQQEFDVSGNFGSGSHTVTVTFLNDLIGGFYPAGTPGLPATGGPWAIDTEDRNLYVMGASLDGGAPTSSAPWELSGDGSYSFNVTAGSNPGAGETAPSGTATTSSDTATVNSTTVAAGSSTSGSSSGLSFVAPATTSTTDPATTTTDTTTSDTAATVASTVAGTAATAPDPTVTPTATTTDTTASTTAATGNWWTNHQGSPGTWVHHHG